MWAVSGDGWVRLWGARREKPLDVDWVHDRGIVSNEVGIRVLQFNVAGMSKWLIQIRYRTLFLLAMIPWIITLIRLIRVWKLKKVLSVEDRDQESEQVSS